MNSSVTKIKQDKLLTLPAVIKKVLKKKGGATIDLGGFLIKIIPKFVGGKSSKALQREDERIWRKIEKTYREIRAGMTREKYPYLYER